MGQRIYNDSDSNNKMRELEAIDSFSVTLVVF